MKKTKLPMMFMEDAIRATVHIMEANTNDLKISSSYNLGTMSFRPPEFAACIKEPIPQFEISYAPNFRQKIADSWLASVDDSEARRDWGWSSEFDLEKTTQETLEK